MKLIWALIFLLSLPAQAKVIDSDITGDGIKDYIEVYKDNDKKHNGIRIKINPETSVFPLTIKKDNLIPVLHDPNGWDFSLFNVHSGKTLTFEGEPLIFKNERTSKSERLFFQSGIDEAPFLIQLYLSYDKNSEHFLFKDFYYIVFSEHCNNEILSIYKLKINELQDIRLQDINKDVLKKVASAQQAQNYISKKLLLKSTYDNYTRAMSLFKNNDIGALKTLLSRTFIHYRPQYEDEICDRYEYIAESYFFSEDIELSNNLGFLLYISGYYFESIALLEEVVRHSPERMVAHLNLGDSYWATNNDTLKNDAIDSYKEYKAKMIEKGKKRLIPDYVHERIRNHKVK